VTGGRSRRTAAVSLGLLALGLLAYAAATNLLTVAQAAIGAGILVVPVVAALALRATGASGVQSIAERRRTAVRRYYVLRDLRAEVERELVRSRRYDRTFVLARAALPTPRSGRRDPSAEALGAHLRRIDRAWVDNRHVYLLLPESDRRAAEQVAGRLLAEHGVSDLRLAAFPRDGVTAGALLATLRGPVETPEREPVPSPTPTPQGGGRRAASVQRGGRRISVGRRRGRREAAAAIDQSQEVG
jgi:hypothetical protein